MNDWWNSIPANQKFYWFLAFPFTAMFIIQTVMTFVGIGNDMGDDMDINDDLEINIDTQSSSDSNYTIEDTAAPFKLLTLRNVIVFFTIFSWCGIVTLNAGLNNIISFTISSLVGLVVAIIISSMFYFVLKLTNSGTLNLNNAVSCVGEVYLTVPGKRKGTGKVMLSIQGSLRELEAFTEGDELPTGTKVIVTQIIENQYLLVEKYS